MPNMRCQQCGADFYRKDSGRLYCSVECGHLAQRTERPACLVCGKPVRLMGNRFCSKSCSNRGVPRFRYRDGLTDYQRHRDERLARAKRSYVKDKTIARIKARKAIPDAQPCESCGSERNVIRHHDDYTEPTVVRFLCRRCHAFQHGRAGVRRT